MAINFKKSFIPIHIALLTVSDTRDFSTDDAGDILANRISAAGHGLADRQIVTDDRLLIATRLLAWCNDSKIDAIISTGGTGLTARDMTVEAHRDIYEKEIDAFGIVFAILSMQNIGTSAVQSRACAGIAAGTYMFALPGSPGACRDGWDKLLCYQLDSRHEPCNFITIQSRL